MTIVKPYTLHLAALLLIIIFSQNEANASPCHDDCHETYEFALNELSLTSHHYSTLHFQLTLDRYDSILKKCVQRCDLQEEEQRAIKRLLRGVK